MLLNRDNIKQSNLAIITNGNYFSYLIIKGMIERFPKEIKAIVIVSGDYRGKRGIKSLWEMSKATSWHYLFYKVSSIMIFKLAAMVFPHSEFSVKKLAENFRIPFIEIPSINKIEAISWIKGFTPRSRYFCQLPSDDWKGNSQSSKVWRYQYPFILIAKIRWVSSLLLGSQRGRKKYGNNGSLHDVEI